MNSVQNLSAVVSNYSLFASGPRISCMEFLLPNKTVRHEEFQRSCETLNIDSFHTYKYLYIMLDSDLDIYECIISQRVEILIFLWRKFYESPWPRDLESEVSVGRSLLHHTLQVWFSCEWPNCPLKFRISLLNEFRRNLCLLPLAEGIDFDDVIGLGITPWNIAYLNEIMELYTDMQVNALVPAATSGDVLFLIKEGLPLIFTRLMKLFDCRKMYACLNLCLRTLAAWNSQDYQNTRHLLTMTASTEAACLLHISHIYLLIIYEADDRRGKTIDKIMSEVRFFINGLNLVRPTVNEYVNELATYTASNYIALTVYQLQLTSKDFFVEFALQNTAEETPTFYAVLLQSYISYLLANWLLDYSMNHWELNPDLPYFIKVFEVYVETRQRSELYMLAEQHKQQLQTQSHNLGKIVKFITNFKEQINKGNRCENIIRHDIRSTSDEVFFENLPQHEQLHLHIYNLLIDRPHNVWYMGNVVLVLKIISQRLNEIEIYRYQPGLTTDFMLNLDVKLAKYFENLAVTFENLYLFSQECWLTAFYLNPTADYYRQIQRCGLRILRSAKSEKSIKHLNPARIKHLQQLQLLKNTKYQLISSTIDVHEIVNHTNYAYMDADYTQLQNALNKLELPEACVKDLLTVCFAARSRYFAWAVPWPELQKRCKMFLNNPIQKRSFVEQSMAEANERLQFLHIDYEKYKHRPMLDYGCIESGYEQDYEPLAAFVEDKDSEPDNSENSDDDYQDKSSVRKRAKSEKQKERERNDKLLLELDDSCFKGGRRTRARAASALRSKQEKQSKMELPIVQESVQNKTEKNEQASMVAESQPKGDLKNLLDQRPVFMNNTAGFIAIRDIWNYSQHEVTNIDLTTTALQEFKNSLTFFSCCASLLVTEENNGINKCTSNCSSVEMQFDMQDDSLSEDDSFSEDVSMEVASKSPEATEEVDDVANSSISLTTQSAGNSETDLQEENDAMQVNLEIYFNKSLDSDYPYDSLKITNSLDCSFYPDDGANEFVKSDDEISIISDDGVTAASEESTAPIELFEDVPTALEERSLVQRLRDIIRTADESGESLDKVQHKLKVIITSVNNYVDTRQQFSDDDDKNGFAGFEEKDYDSDSDSDHIDCEDNDDDDDDEDSDDDDEDSDDDDDEDQEEKDDNDGKKREKKDDEENKRNDNEDDDTDNEVVKSTQKETTEEHDKINKTQMQEAGKFHSNSLSIEQPRNSVSILNMSAHFNDLSFLMDSEIHGNDQINIENIQVAKDITLSPRLEMFSGLEKSANENYETTQIFDNTTEKIQTATNESNKLNVQENEKPQNPTSPTNTIPRVKKYVKELMSKIESSDDENLLESSDIQLPDNSLLETEKNLAIAAELENNADTLISLTISSNNTEQVHDHRLQIRLVCPLDNEASISVSKVYERPITCSKRSTNLYSNPETSATKRSKTSDAASEQQEKNDSEEEENFPTADIDCTSAYWQPQVRLQRLQVVQGHVIRDVRVCVRRLDKRAIRKKAVRFAPSSMVYEYIEDDKGVVKHSELLKGCSSTSSSDTEEGPKMRIMDVDDSDDDDEYEDVDDAEYSPTNDYMQPAMSKRRPRRTMKKHSIKRAYSPINPLNSYNKILLSSNEADTILAESQQQTNFIQLSCFEEELVLGN